MGWCSYLETGFGSYREGMEKTTRGCCRHPGFDWLEHTYEGLKRVPGRLRVRYAARFGAYL